MKFYSEVTKKLYETQEDLFKAEKEVKNRENSRAKRAKELDAAIDAAIEAQEKVNKLMTEFIKDYGSFHTTITKPNSTSNIDNVLAELLKKVME